MWDALDANPLSAAGKAEMGSASSAPKYRTMSSGEERAPSHFSLAESVPAENITMRYPRGLEGCFSMMTAASGSSNPVRYQKSDDWRNL